ncbi:MAG: bifunctional chorismate mutase/prephenate dehydratase, partial [Chlorobi bacterium]|nr:bifunctional chorismate mutase/prephenate dehydratase [Chlorobiota bacterium]
MSELDKLRELINNVDSEIIELLSERRKLSKDIIREKDDKNSPIRDQNREEALLKRIIKL